MPVSLISRMRRLCDRRGFTLVELLVVILIIGLLAAIALPTFLNQQDKAKDSEATQGLSTLYRVAKSDATSREGRFSTGTDLVAALADSEPQLADAIVAASEAGAGEFVVCSNSSNNVLRMSAGSDSGNSFLLEVSNQRPRIDRGNCAGFSASAETPDSGGAAGGDNNATLGNTPVVVNVSNVGHVDVAANDNVYFAGSFSSVAGQARNSVAAVSSQGSLLPFDPNVSGGYVADVVVSGNTVYLAGTFTSVGGQPRARVAAVNATTGELISAFNADVSGGSVAQLVLSGSTLYMSGSFTNVGGQTRNYVAAVDATTGNLISSFNPNPDQSPAAMAVSGSTVYLGGYFATVGGGSRPYLAAVNATTGTLVGAFNANPSNAVMRLAVSGSTVYASGYFNNIGGGSRPYLAALDASSGNLVGSFSPGPNNLADKGLALTNGSLYVAGNFTTIGGQSRNRLAALDPATGTATDWNSTVAPGNALTVGNSPDGSTVAVGTMSALMIFTSS